MKKEQKYRSVDIAEEVEWYSSLFGVWIFFFNKFDDRFMVCFSEML